MIKAQQGPGLYCIPVHYVFEWIYMCVCGVCALVRLCVCVCLSVIEDKSDAMVKAYEVATISRLPENLVLFCKRAT